MVPKSESLCKKKMNCLGYVLIFRSLLRVFDFGILALSLSTAKNGEISPWFFVGNFGETDTFLTVS